ncbi:hypothetical protein BJX66DRAFT_310968, partial [Aspergillus keveii]
MYPRSLLLLVGVSLSLFSLVLPLVLCFIRTKPTKSSIANATGCKRKVIMTPSKSHPRIPSAWSSVRWRKPEMRKQM